MKEKSINKRILLYYPSTLKKRIILKYLSNNKNNLLKFTVNKPMFQKFEKIKSLKSPITFNSKANKILLQILIKGREHGNTI